MVLIQGINKHPEIICEIVCVYAHTHTHTHIFLGRSVSHQHLKETYYVLNLRELGQGTLPFCALFSFTCKMMELFCDP